MPKKSYVILYTNRATHIYVLHGYSGSRSRVELVKSWLDPPSTKSRKGKINLNHFSLFQPLEQLENFDKQAFLKWQVFSQNK